MKCNPDTTRFECRLFSVSKTVLSLYMAIKIFSWLYRTFNSDTPTYLPEHLSLLVCRVEGVTRISRAIERC